jgi:hypothetical protein
MIRTEIRQKKVTYLVVFYRVVFLLHHTLNLTTTLDQALDNPRKYTSLLGFIGKGRQNYFCTITTRATGILFLRSSELLFVKSSPATHCRETQIVFLNQRRIKTIEIQ